MALVALRATKGFNPRPRAGRDSWRSSRRSGGLTLIGRLVPNALVPDGATPEDPRCAATSTFLTLLVLPAIYRWFEDGTTVT